MRIAFVLLISLMIFLSSCREKNESNLPHTDIIKIAFGSCGSHEDPLPLLDIASAEELDAFVFLGDNVYGDTRDMNVLKGKYDSLGQRPEFKNLRNNTNVLAVWDDHDYGENDAGRHYPMKEESKEIFLDFWNVPMTSNRRNHKGIYGTEYIEKGDLRVQIILLDTRTFRDDLVHRAPEDSIKHKNDYIPNLNADSTLLGSDQWAWLEKELKSEADIRIIASSIQFSHEYNGWESWTNVPHQQRKMIDLIAKTKADGVVFISGDVHWGEISKMQTGNGYPIYDVTSSGIVQTWPELEPNKNRVGDAVPQNNIGLIEISKANQTSIKLSLIDSTAMSVESTIIELGDISF